MSAKRKAPPTLGRPAVKPSAKAHIGTHLNERSATVITPTSVPLRKTPVSTTDGRQGSKRPRSPSLPPSSKTSVSKPQEVIEIESDSSSSFEEEEGEDEDGDDGKYEGQLAGHRGEGQKLNEKQEGTLAPNRANETPRLDSQDGVSASHHDQDVDIDMSDAEPTLGDLARESETVDVVASLAAREGTTAGVSSMHLKQLVASQPTSIAPPSLSSLGSVLNQALRTDDSDLLESCLQMADLAVIRNTIQRMETKLAGVLLTKLAARMNRRPGRAHSSMVWVQWILVAHGGILATQPELLRILSELSKVLQERSRGMNSLLALKGRLDMLEAQLQVRRGSAQYRRRKKDAEDDEDDNDDDDSNDDCVVPGKSGRCVIYVEGEEDKEGAGDGMANDIAVNRRHAAANHSGLPNGMPNGIDDAQSDEDSDGGDESSDDEDSIGSDTDIPDEDSLHEDQVVYDDADSDEGEESAEDVAAQPAKVQKTKRAFSRPK